MAATVGATLTGATFPLRHSGLGPYQSTGGNYYWFGRDGATNIGNARCWKASDPMSAFTAQTAKLMSTGATVAIEAMWAGQNGNTIYVFTQLATGAVLYNFYTMDTDTWGLVTSATTVAAAAFAPTAGFTFVSAVYRTTAGELVLGYCAGLTAMSSGFHMWRYARVAASTGAVIGSVANVDNGGSVNWMGGPAVLGASDRVHFFLQGNTSPGNMYQRTLSAANALQTFPSAITSAGLGLSLFLWSVPGVSYSSGATVVAPFEGTIPGTAKFTSADSPTVSLSSAAITDASLRSVNSASVHASAYNSGTLHFLYSRNADFDLYRDTSTNDGTSWGTDTNELAASIAAITPRVYVRAGNTVLAMVLDDGGTIKYAEITLAGAPAATSLIWEPVGSLTRTLRSM